MEVTNERLTILKLLEERGNVSSKCIEKETGLPRECVLEEVKYLKRMEQIECPIRLASGDFLKIQLTKEGQETLEKNRNIWKKISSKIKGFSIAGFGIDFK